MGMFRRRNVFSHTMGRCFEEEMYYVASSKSHFLEWAIDRWAVAFITMMETTSKHILYVSHIKFSLQGNTTTAATEMDKEDLL